MAAGETFAPIELTAIPGKIIRPCGFLGFPRPADRPQ
jgi:hypothetical protein